MISLKLAARLLIVEMLASSPTKMRDKKARRASRSEVGIVNAKKKPPPFFPNVPNPVLRIRLPLRAPRPCANSRFRSTGNLNNICLP